MEEGRWSYPPPAMHPILITLPGGFQIHTYGLALALAILAPVYMTQRWGKEEGMPEDFGMDLALICFLGGIGGARLEYVRANWSDFQGNLLQIVNIRQGGQVLYGGVILVVLLLMLYVRRRKIPPLKLLDLCVPMLALGQAIGRMGCLAAGCCYGKEADVAWAITFTEPLSRAPQHLALHPTQIYDSLYCLMLCGLLVWMRPRRKFQGQLFLTFFTLYPILRTINETFRADLTRGYFLEGLWGEVITNGQGISLMILAGCAVGWYIIPRTQRTKATS